MKYEKPGMDIIYLGEELLTGIVGASGGDNSDNMDGSELF